MLLLVVQHSSSVSTIATTEVFESTQATFTIITLNVSIKGGGKIQRVKDFDTNSEDTQGNT